MKIYIASSWKNEMKVLKFGRMLQAEGHEVDMFCDTSGHRYVFHFSEIGHAEILNAINFLEDERSQKAFKEDRKWIEWSDALILLLPAGNSSHLEAGYAKGKGKKLYIVGEFPCGEFDVMYGFADGLFINNRTGLLQLINILKQ